MMAALVIAAVADFALASLMVGSLGRAARELEDLEGLPS
jgi:hypothetical protein